MLTELCPGDIGAELRPESPSCCVRGLDDAVRERPVPGGCLFLQPSSGATGADQVSDLVEGYEIADLAPYRWHADETPTLGPTPMYLRATSAPECEHDAVRQAQLLNVLFETVRHARRVSQRPLADDGEHPLAAALTSAVTVVDEVRPPMGGKLVPDGSAPSRSDPNPMLHRVTKCTEPVRLRPAPRLTSAEAIVTRETINLGRSNSVRPRP